jgi:hypothetical protein
MEEAFVYKWTDHLRDMHYIGSHKGREDDGYVCSSDAMKVEYKRRPHDFTREILDTGTWEIMYHLESQMLQEMDVRNDPTYYNMHNNEAPFFNQGPKTENHKKKMSEAMIRRYLDINERDKTSKSLKSSTKAIAHRKRFAGDLASRAKNSMSHKTSIKAIAARKKIHDDPKVRAKWSISAKKLWEDPEKRNKLSISLKSSVKAIEHRKSLAYSKSGSYSIIFPDGRCEIIKNLRLFCRTHNLNQANMCQVAKGVYSQSKGFKCKRIS